MPRKGRKRKKTRTHVVEDLSAQSALASSDALKIPKSAVVSKVTWLLAVGCWLVLCEGLLSIPHVFTAFFFFFIILLPSRYEGAKQNWKL